ncbi:TatD family hydrolase [Roseburia sp. MSJ-14]|uniref:TatD family hydrolase n=1 Tax=Roseburia sp. MSJ-14 TaxID=2841514 RepID=UPI001C0FCB73|nr:TatD family hydrolase [Roseburia sp. MSJ-14]MBU5474082.1 TatD family hydrolase [Roseburia sp. MSJ-14]
MIFESHAHYDDAQFDNDREELLTSMKENGIETIINVGSDFCGCEKTVELMNKYDFIYGAIGIHPSDIGDLNDDTCRWLEEKTTLEKIVAIGEIGLDYYWDKEEEIQKAQREWFEWQMKLAKREGLPVIIHSRDAAEDTLKLMKGIHAEEIPGVIHCFSYSKEMAAEYVKMGYYIGIGGVVTFKNAKKVKEVAATVPMERILLETDCPYLAPEPNRGTRNSSLNLPYVAAEIAHIRGITPEEVIEATRRNAQRLFGVKAEKE